VGRRRLEDAPTHPAIPRVATARERDRRAARRLGRPSATRPAIDDEQRFGILRRLLHDQELDLRDRFAGSVLVLYGQPTTRIVALRTTDIRTAPDGMITLRLGRGEIPLPEPLAARLPAPILAERIGIHQSRAAAWVRMAGGTYADYVSVRTHN
jgi:hypothetical protein